MRKSSFFIYICSLASLLLMAMPAKAASRVVRLSDAAAARFQPGTIVIQARQRVLLFILGGGRAIRYPVAVPKRGREWSGYARVYRMERWPAWAPPAVVKRDHPELPDYIPGGASNNPVGAAAIMLDRSQVAIHGTAPKMRRSIGTAASYGCIRMYNEDVTDLYGRIGIGTVVLMIQ